MRDFFLYELFPIVCNMSLTASAVILAVLPARLLLRRAPKVFSYALWAVVLFRLVCPVSFTSAVSLMGALGAPAQEQAQRTSVMEYIPTDIVRGTSPAAAQLPSEPAAPVPAAPSDTVTAAQPEDPAPPLSGPMAMLTLTWLTGIVLLLLYSTLSLLRLRRRLVGAVRLRDNVYLADHIPSPFVMGLLRPKIYLPSTLKETERGYILRHEQYHIRRRDYLVKFLAFLALCVHWFNPLVWAAFVLAGKDMEMSCDEAVVKELGEDIRADYSASLLSLATGRRIVAGMPLAFGEGDTGGRIRNLLKWKRPRPWVIGVCAAVCVGLIALCAVNPGAGGSSSGDSGKPAGNADLRGQWASAEDYVQHLMNACTQVQYYKMGADGSVHADEPVTAAVTGRKLSSLEKGGEVAGLDPDGVLEEWTFHYLVKLDADPETVAPVGGQYFDDEGYFDPEGQGGHAVVALRYGDGSYDILYDDVINDGLDFFGYHDTAEEAIYDWYVTDRGLSLPLYVEDWGDQIDFPEDSVLGNYPVRRYDGDGFFLYVPIVAWTRTDPFVSRSHGHWEWQSAYGSGSAITVDRFSQPLEDEYTVSQKQGFAPVDDAKQVWMRHRNGVSERYCFYPAADGTGCFRVWTRWIDAGIRNSPYSAIEPQVMELMAKRFAAVENFNPAAGASTRSDRTVTQTVPVGKGSAEVTVAYTTRQGSDGEFIDTSAYIYLKNVSGVFSISRIGAVEQDQIVYLNDKKTAIVPVNFTAGLNEGGEGVQPYGAVVVVDLTGQGVQRRVLSQKELERYRKELSSVLQAEDGSAISAAPVNGFFSSYYGDVRDLNFEEFLRYYPGDGAASEAEFEALKALDGWPFRNVERLDKMPVPITRISAASVNETLKTYAGITAADLTNTGGTFYLEDYDAYYVYTSDFGPGMFTAESGEQAENYVYLRGSGNVLTLRVTPGTGAWQIVSFLSLER